MTRLTALERAALDAILDELGENRTAVEQQLSQASVVGRENTGGGFFADLTVPGAAPLARAIPNAGDNIWISIDGLDYGLGMILHFENGLPVLLEGYAVGPEDTSKIDFERARFAVADEPKPFSDGS